MISEKFQYENRCARAESVFNICWNPILRCGASCQPAETREFEGRVPEMEIRKRYEYSYFEVFGEVEGGCAIA